MRRRSRRTSGTLFPFVSVLICLIGTLSLLIAAQGLTSSIGSGDNLVHTGDVILEDLAQAQQELEMVQAQHSYVAGRLDSLRFAQSDVNPALERQWAAQEMLREAQAEEDSLRQHLEDIRRRVRAAERQSASQGSQLTVDPHWRGEHDLNPVFVECRSGAAVILANRQRIAHSEVSNSSVLESLLSHIESDSQWCLFLLIRKGGVDVFDDLYSLSNARVRLGYQPVLTTEELDVSEWPKPAWLE